mgnify:CR=1 FL=1
MPSMRTDTDWEEKPKTSPGKRDTGAILKSEGTKALEALARLRDTVVKRKLKPPEKKGPEKTKPREGEPAPVPDTVPEGCTELVARVKGFLETTRSGRVKRGLMPETPESHADIEPLFAGLRPGDINALKGNRLTIDPTEKTHVPLLKQLLRQCGTEAVGKAAGPATTPAGFLYHIEDICKVTAKDSEKMQEKTSAKLTHTAAICMAYLEILEEAGLEPLPNADEFSHRTARFDPEIGAAKAALLRQSEGEPEPEGMPPLDESAVASEIEDECRSGMTTGEAFQIAVIHAERRLEHLRSAKKRETLFKMRCHLTHKFFEVTKKMRKEGHPADTVLKQKPRYKTPCIMLVRHPAYEHCEVVSIQPQSALSYWGNPDAEKETHAIVKARPEIKEETPSLAARIMQSETCSRAGRWIAAGLLLQTMALGAFLGMKSCTKAMNPGPGASLFETKPAAQSQPQTEPVPPLENQAATDEKWGGDKASPILIEAPPAEPEQITTGQEPKAVPDKDRRKKEKRQNSVQW